MSNFRQPHVFANFKNVFQLQGQFCSNCGIGCCLESNCLRKANLTHKCKEVAVVSSGQETTQNIPTAKDSNVEEEGGRYVIINNIIIA